MIDKHVVLRILGEVPFPGSDTDIVRYGVVRECEVDDKGVVTLACEVMGKNESLAVEVEQAIRERLAGAGLRDVRVSMKFRTFGLGGADTKSGPKIGSAPKGPHGTSPDPWADRQAIAGVRRVIAVASGKGGVGKSTVSVNLALALRAKGFQVGLLDADIYGPSEPVMLGIGEIEPTSDDGKRINPIIAHGLKTISIGYLVDEGKPVIWRGPLIMKLIEQFLRDVNWGTLDYLVVDLPPGTGDAQLSLVQKVPLDGVVIVTTPQDVALADVRRGQAMFESVEVPVLGVVENMSMFHCPNCGHESHIFAHGGGATMAKDLGLPVLATLPLDINLRASMDEGKPLMVSHPDHAVSKVFDALATEVVDLVP